ncbi:MAG TPA: hypothetical protein VGR41_07870 [Actinomycetota bacterium]|jgi:hypothetical protein|nr:hypothetical protein [Actinomycetota bacterium]
MNEQLFEGLTAWEAGDLPTGQLLERHPEAAGLLALHERLSAIVSEPIPDPERSLARVREQIADRPASARPKRASKVFVAALVAAALTGSAAIAAPGAVRSVVDGVRSGIERLFGSDDAGGPGKAGTPSAPTTHAPSQGASNSLGGDDEGNGAGGSGNQGGSGQQQDGPTQGGGDEGSQGDEGGGEDEPQGGEEDEQRDGGEDEEQGSDDGRGSGGDSDEDDGSDDGDAD